MRCPRTRRRGGGGFTMVEALIALLLMMIGILGMGALAGAVVKSNLEANNRTAATNLAEKTLGMLRTEALSWNESNWAPAQDVTDADEYMPLLSALPGGTAVGSTGFQEMTQNFGDSTQAFTRDLEMISPSADGATFCVHYNLTWLQPNESIRADVRVYWMRRNANPQPLSFYQNCGTSIETVYASNLTDLWCVARTTLLQRNSGGARR